MARPSALLAEALRETAMRLETGASTYRWSHFAHCNCGNLAQTLTRLSPRQIYDAAAVREGDWAQQALTMDLPDYGDRPALDEGAWEPEDLGACPNTGVPMTQILRQMAAAGLEAADIAHLERLSDPQIRRRLGTNSVDFPYADRGNVISYLRAWAEVMEEQLAQGDLQPLSPMAAE